MKKLDALLAFGLSGEADDLRLKIMECGGFKEAFAIAQQYLDVFLLTNNI